MMRQETTQEKTDYKELMLCLILISMCLFLIGCGGKTPIPTKSNYADTTSERAYAFFLQGRYSEAIKLYTISLKEYQKLDEQHSAAQTSSNLSVAYYETGNFERAKDLTSQAIAICKMQNEKENMLKLTVNLGAILIQLDDPSAKKLLEEALNHLTERKSLRGRCLIGLALINVKDKADATKLLEEAESIFKNTQDTSGEAAIHFVKGISARNAGDFKKSADFLTKALEIDRKQRSTITVMRDLEELALTYESIDTNLAKEYYMRALGIAKFYGMKDKIKKIEAQLTKLQK